MREGFFKGIALAFSDDCRNRSVAPGPIHTRLFHTRRRRLLFDAKKATIVWVAACELRAAMATPGAI